MPMAAECTVSGSMKPKPYSRGGLYASFPQDLEICLHTDDSGKDRGVYNLRQRKPGDVLFSVKPHVAALSNKNLAGYCSNCFGEESSLLRCTGCKVLHYCNLACQKADWALHKQECAAIGRWLSSNPNPSVPSDAIRCLGRILWKKRKLGNDSVWAREIDGLQSHRTSLNKDHASRNVEVYTQLAHAVVRFIALDSPPDMAEYGINSAADFLDLISRFETNTFTVSSPALVPLGACVSPVVALLNHSCDPNAVIVFPRVSTKNQEPQMQVIALKNICPHEEILTAYIDTTLPRVHRQKQLRETYHFDCQCRLCSPSSNRSVDLRDAMFCPTKCGTICSLPTEADVLSLCTNCKSAVKDANAVIDAVRIGQDALDKAEALQWSNPQKSIQLTTKLIPILTAAGLVPAAHPLLALSRLNASLLITNMSSVPANPEEKDMKGGDSSTNSAKDAQETLDEAIRAAMRAFTGLSQILPDGHPARGIALAELGKLLSVDEPWPKTLPEGMETPTLNSASYPPSGPKRLKLAYGTLVEAWNELNIGFGSGGGEVGKDLRKLLVDVEKEWSIWNERINSTFHDARLAGELKRIDGK